MLRDAAVPATESRRYERTDLGNAELFVELHRDRLRHVRERRRWLVWNDGRWRVDETGEAERAAKEVARELLRRAAEVEGPDERKRAVQWAMTSQQESRIRALLALASTEPEIALSATALDPDPFLLACANGTLDLRTGELREHRPEDLISLGTEIPYDAEAECPRWLRFLEEVFDGDAELVDFVWRTAGYTLTGDTREHALFVLHGSGCNGKSTFVETLTHLLGEFSRTSPFDSFARTRGDRGARNDLARLHRARLVVASESGEGRRLDEATVKLLTGGDTVAARFLYSEFFEYRPEFKLVLVTNHRPRVDGSDDAIWRRLRLVPFEVSFQGCEDKGLGDALRDELPGILAWAVRGCLEWQKSGLGLPAKVRQATAAYRHEEDLLGAFLEERCVLNGEVSVAEFREAYQSFCRELGENPLAPNVLGRQLARRGITAQGRHPDRVYAGIRLAP